MAIVSGPEVLILFGLVVLLFLLILCVRNHLRYRNFQQELALLLSSKERDPFSLLSGVRELQKRLSESEKKLKIFQNLFETLKEGLILTNEGGEILYLNPRAAELLGLSHPRAGLNLKEILREEPLWQAFARKEASVFEVELFWPFPRHLEVTFIPISEGFLGFLLRDITPFRRLSDMRRDFVSYLAHEIRTPLTAIEGYTEDLLEEAPEEFKDELSVILRNARRLSRLIKDLQFLSRLELQGIPAEAYQDVDLVEVVRSAEEVIKPVAEEKGVEVLSKLPEQAFVRGSFDDLLRAVLNILDNAVKFSPSGAKVEIDLWPEEKFWVLAIRDYGPGIPDSEKGRIFERFYRGKRADRQGTGLGLAIAKHILLAHGGKIEVESEPGQETVFRLVLPRRS